MVLLFILLFCMGCSKTIWYKSKNTSLETGVQDSLECMYEANKAYGNPVLLYYQCMEVRGYKQLERMIGKPITNLEQIYEVLPGTRIRQVDSYGLIYVMGK